MAAGLPFDPYQLLAVKLLETTYAYIERDVALYALGVGACGRDSVDADELKYVYHENGQQFIQVNCSLKACANYLPSLGLGCLHSRNVALLFKWIWGVLKGEQKIWVELIQREYQFYALGDLWLRDRKQMSPIWEDIMRICGRASSIFGFWQNHVRVSIGSGEDVRFWWDTWASKILLTIKYPRLYSLSSNRLGSVKEFGHWEGNNWSWDWTWRRGLFEWEVDVLGNLQDSIPLPCRVNHKSKVEWELEKSGEFSISGV